MLLVATHELLTEVLVLNLPFSLWFPLCKNLVIFNLLMGCRLCSLRGGRGGLCARVELVLVPVDVPGSNHSRPAHSFLHSHFHELHGCTRSQTGILQSAVDLLRCSVAARGQQTLKIQYTGRRFALPIKSHRELVVFMFSMALNASQKDFQDSC